MVMQAWEGFALLALIALILTHSAGFSNLVLQIGGNYKSLVEGLQPTGFKGVR